MPDPSCAPLPQASTTQEIFDMRSVPGVLRQVNLTGGLQVRHCQAAARQQGAVTSAARGHHWPSVLHPHGVLLLKHRSCLHYLCVLEGLC
jgi:hypothetical protein